MSEHAAWQIGFLQEELGGVRVMVEFDDDEEPPASVNYSEWFVEHERELVDVRAETVVDEWLFERSLLVRDAAGRIVRGALRMGELRWRAALGEYSHLSLEQAKRALALHGRRDHPTDRQRREASKRIARPELREMLARTMTSPDLGSEMFRRWGRAFARWGVDSGPLSTRGRPRRWDASRDEGKRDEDMTDRLGVAAFTPAKRRYRDRLDRLPTEPRAAIRSRAGLPPPRE